MAQRLGDLGIGVLVKDISTLYYGKPIIWEIADKNHAGYPANSISLISRRILAAKCFDANETDDHTSYTPHGNNRYNYSNIRQWLNSDAAAGAWYTPQHSEDRPPSSQNVRDGYNPYDTESGFLSGFSDGMKAAVLPTSLTVVKTADGGGSEIVVDKVFLASNTEVGVENENGIAEGVKLALFSNDNSRVAYPTAEAVSISNYVNNNFVTTKGYFWWLRTPYTDNPEGFQSSNYYILPSGALYVNSSYEGKYGVRPLCNVSSETLVSDSVDSDGAYTIIWKYPPTTPAPLTIPAPLLAGGQPTITWGESTDPQNEFAGYRLDRSVNGGEWAQVYQGTNRQYKDTIPAGATTIQYRVRAYNLTGLESDNTVSPVMTVSTNENPAISGTDSGLGVKTGAFSQSYIVTDPDPGDTITVKEFIDGVQVRQYTAASGENQAFDVSAEAFIKLLNGSHSLKVTAADQWGAVATRIWAFTRNESQIEVDLITPLTADDMPERVLINVPRMIPTGAVFQVLACNNGNDASPAWEDVTNYVMSGLLYKFQNTVKTAADWGVNVKVLVDRNGAAGDCFITSIGGNFD